MKIWFVQLNLKRKHIIGHKQMQYALKIRPIKFKESTYVIAINIRGKSILLYRNRLIANNVCTLSKTALY